MTAVISAKVMEPQFEGQTKTKLGNSEVKGVVESLFGDKLATFLENAFSPDKSIFKKADLSFDILSERMRELAFLNTGLEINIADDDSGKKHTFMYKGGLVEFIDYLNENRTPLHKKPILVSGERDDVSVEIAIQYNDSYIEFTAGTRGGHDRSARRR